MPDKNPMCVSQEGDGDALSCSSDTSRWSSPPALCCDSDAPLDPSDCEDKTYRTPDVLPPVVWQRRKQTGSKKGGKLQGDYKQRSNHHALKLPPVGPLQEPTPSVQQAGATCVIALKSQVWDLQQQLAEARTENKLLKRVQQRHMVALKHFQDSKDSVSQIVVKHNNEAKALQGLLRQTRASRDNLSRQLQAAENKLRSTKAAVQHLQLQLQLLHQDHSLLERDELVLKLDKASAQLEDKDRRIQDLDRKLELCQASFKRQLVAEQRKVREARKASCYLEEDVYQLTREVQDRGRELEKYNIYHHRYLKGPSTKGRENKMVQTKESLFTPECALSFLETEEELQQQEGSVDRCCDKQVLESLVLEGPEGKLSAHVAFKENLQKDQTGTVFFKDNPGEESLEKSPEGRPVHQTEDGCAAESEAAETLCVPEEKQETEHHIGLSPDQPEPERKEVRRKYTFRRSTENLHNGRPAHSSDGGEPLGSERLTGETEKIRTLTYLHSSDE